MNIEERINNKTIKYNSGCWLWQGGVARRYGVIKIEGKTKRVHRVVWELNNGSIPDGMFVCHSCDVPRCVNPEHLFIGTHTDNMRDMIQKGRKSKIVWNTNITHCKHGHIFDNINTRYYMWDGKQHRCCKICSRLSNKKSKAKNKSNE